MILSVLNRTLFSPVNYFSLMKLYFIINSLPHVVDVEESRVNFFAGTAPI